MPMIPLDKIRLDGGTQMRAEINKDVVRDYVDKMEAGETFPPVALFDDGSDLWLADGFHRVQAAIYRGDEMIAADVQSGSVRDAILCAVGANNKHGLLRTNADKRRAVEALLSDPEWQRNSANWLARTAKVSVPFAASLKSSLLTVNSDVVEASDGRTMNTANIGRKPATERTVINAETGEVIDNPMVETVTVKPFHKPVEPDESDTGIGTVYRGNAHPQAMKPIRGVVAPTATTNLSLPHDATRAARLIVEILGHEYATSLATAIGKLPVDEEIQ